MARADDEFMLSTPERQRRAARRRRRWKIAAAAALGAIVLLVIARPVRHSIRGWQARRHAQRALPLIEQQSWDRARDEAVAAYRLKPTEPQAIRAVALLLSRAGQPDALDFWKQLEAVGQVSREDLRDEARVALRLKDTARAAEVSERALGPQNGGPTPADWLIATNVALAKQAYETAKDWCNKVLADARSSRREQLEAIIALQSVAVNTNAESALATIDERLTAMANGTDDVSLDTLSVITWRILSPSKVRFIAMTPSEVAQKLSTHPLAKTQHKLLARDLEIAQHPDRRAAIIGQAVDEWKKADNQSLTALAAWLYRNGEYQRIIDAIPLDRALQARELFLQYVDTLGALGRWNDIRKIIETERFPLDPVIEHMYLARCFMQQGQQNGADNNWQRALEAASGNANKLLMLADYAEKNGAKTIALKAFEAAAAAAPRMRDAQQGRLRLAYDARDTRMVHRVLAEELKIWPNDIGLQHEEAYVRLLLLPPVAVRGAEPSTPATPEETSHSAEIKSIEQLAAALLEQEPLRMTHRTLLALARLKQSRAADAFAAYRGFTPVPAEVSAGALAVHAAALERTAHHSEARKEASQIPPAKLLPEEAQLIADIPLAEPTPGLSEAPTPPPTLTSP